MASSSHAGRRSESAIAHHEIILNNLHLHEQAELAWTALCARNDPPEFFQHGSEVAQVVDAGDGPVISHLSTAGLKGHVDRSAAWLRRTKDGDLIAARPPTDVIEDMLAMEKPLPRIKGITGTPVFDSEGELCLTEGYQPSTGLLYRPRGNPIPDVPEHPDETDLLRAKMLIRHEWLGDFPFNDEASRAHAIAIALTVITREMVAGPTPLTAVDAPSAGTGKGLLLRSESLVIEGSEPAVMTETRDDDELRKRITSMLVRGRSMAQLDNVKRRLESAALEGLLTSTIWTDRVLGRTQTIEVPNRTVWLVTGNNLQMGSEVARRTVWIRLDSKEDRPWERSSFRHADLAGWVLRHRHELLWALLVLVRNWISKGRPQWEGKPLGSFEAWCQVTGGILETANIPGFLENRQELYKRADQESDEWRNFIARVWGTYGDSPKTTSALYPMARDLLPGAFGFGDKQATEQALKTRLAIEFRKRVDRRFGDFFWRTAIPDSHSKAARWAVEHVQTHGSTAGDEATKGQGPAEPPRDFEGFPDSLAGVAVVAGVDSECLSEINSEFLQTQVGAVEPPQAPQPPQSDSAEPRKFAGVPSHQALTPARPPQCVKCGRGMSRRRIRDVCGVCARRTEGARL